VVAVFSVPSFLDLPDHGPFRRRRAANMRIKYMFIAQRYGLMQARATVGLLPAAAGGVCTANVVSARHRRVGGSAIRKVVAAKPAG